MKKTILHLTGMKSSKYGALEKYFIQLSRKCRDRGYKTIIQYEQPPKSKKYLDLLENSKTEVIIFDTQKNSILAILFILKLIINEKPYLITNHFVSDKVRFYTGVLARMAKVPVRISFIRFFMGFKRKSFKRYIYNNYNFNLGVSDAVSNNFIQCGVNSDTVKTHYQGIFKDTIESERTHSSIRKIYSIPEENFVIGCIAFDVHWKGIDLLFNALKNIGDLYQTISLLLIGIDPQKSDLPKLAHRLGIYDKVYWAGIIDDANKILKAVDLYVQPSRYGEGLSLSIMEAMSQKLPVIATKVAGQEEAVVDGINGYIVPPGKIQSLENAILRSFKDPYKMKLMGENSFARYEKFFRGEDSIRILMEKYFKIKKQ